LVLTKVPTTMNAWEVLRKTSCMLIKPSQSSEDPIRPHALIGAVAGLVGGVSYLAAQMTFSATLQGGSGSETLQRMSAMLLGPDAAAPTVALTPTVIGFALLIHLSLSAMYGKWIDAAVMRLKMLPAAGVGACIGGLMFVVNRLLIAPYVFPWFERSNNLITAADHLLFGVVTALWVVHLRRFIHRED
jgi:hypothetical protein